MDAELIVPHAVGAKRAHGSIVRAQNAASNQQEKGQIALGAFPRSFTFSTCF